MAHKNRPVRWESPTESNRRAGRRRAGGAIARTRPRVEVLEDRTLLTVVFEPLYGAEPTYPGVRGGLNDVEIYLLFQGASWQTTYRPLADGILHAALSLFSPSSPFRSDISQYGSDGRVVEVFDRFDSNNLTSGFGVYNVANVFSHDFGNDLTSSVRPCD